MTVLNTGLEVNEKIGNPVPLEDINKAQRETRPAAPTNSYSSNAGASSSTMNTSVIGDHLTLPISSLSPYQNKWVIKARVTSKSAIRTWANPKGEGKLFSMDLMDESGEIRATAFKAECDKFYEMIQVRKIARKEIRKFQLFQICVGRQSLSYIEMFAETSQQTIHHSGQRF